MPLPTTLGLGWIFAEDSALKQYLSDITVTDATSGVNGRAVPVWYRAPEAEERQRTYPYITIDLIDIREANERDQVNRIQINKLLYSPPDPLPVEIDGNSMLSDRPVAIDLQYQIMSVSRSSRHDRQMQAALWRKFPGKWGALYVPNDETARTMQLLGRAATHDVDEFGKRSFRTMWTITICSELWPEAIKQVADITDITLGIDFTGDPSLVLSSLDCYDTGS